MHINQQLHTPLAPCMRRFTLSSTMKSALTLLSCALFAISHTQAQSDLLGSLTKNINIEGLETQFDPVTGVATAKGDVHIKYEGVEISSSQADYNSVTGDIIAKGNVTVLKDGQIYRGESIIYNIKNQSLSANNIRSSLPPIFYDTVGFKTDTEKKDRIDGEGSIFTTHDSEVPNYRIKAKSITIYPDDRVVMRGAKVYAGKTPVLYLPYFVQPLNDELGYYFQPGYASEWGAFLLNQYGIMHGDHTLAKYHLDLRSARGVAIGADFESVKWKSNPNIGHLKLYYAYDTDPTMGVNDSTRPDTQVDENRYIIAFQHRIFIPGPQESSWYLDFDITKLSDVYMLEDYFPNEFRINPEPDNHIKLVKRDDRFVATLLARVQVNDFFHADQRLPELAFDFTRSKIGNSNFYYQGTTSAGFLQDKLSSLEQSILDGKIKTQTANLKAYQADGIIDGQLQPVKNSIFALAGTSVSSVDSIYSQTAQTELLSSDAVANDIANLKAELSQDEFFRAYSYNEVLYPMSFGNGNWLNFVPRIGGGLAYYTNVSGGQSDVSTQTKPIFSTGFDLSAKFSKTWNEVQNRALGIDGLRHTIQPYVNYSFLDIDENDGIPTIDHLAPTTRPRPIDVPLYTAIDDLQSWNVARIGVRNLIQTKRDGTSFNYAGINTYADIFIEDPEFDRSISNLYNDLFWNPLPWLSLSIGSQLPMGGDYSFTEVNTSVTWMPNTRFSWTVGQMLLSDNPIFRDSNLFYSRIYTKINDNWGFSMNHIYEVDDSTLQYQSYSVTRDLASWTMAVGALIRNNYSSASDVSSYEYGMVVSLTLKDFPQVSIPLVIDPSPNGRGGNGGNGGF